MSACPGYVLTVTNPTAITGAHGELIARLIQLLRGNGPVADTDRVKNLGFWVLYAVGNNSPLARAVVLDDVNERPTPGTMLERQLQTGRAVTAEQWLELLNSRLLEIIDFGIEEEFLVVALRDRITRFVDEFADVGSTAEKRARGRAHMLALADDPEYVERFRDDRAAENPAYANKPLEDVAEELRETAERLLHDPSADDAKAAWSAKDAWDRDVAALLDDEVVDEWTTKRLRTD